MADVQGYSLPDDLYYHKEHMWVRVEGNKAVVGMDDFSQKLAGELSYVELPGEGDEVSQDEVVGTYETGKWMGKLYAPVSGTVVKINTEVEDEPSLVNEDPYGKGWLFEIELSNPDEVNNLMRGEAAVKWLEEEIKKHVK
ncbi:glycine cleavage system protein GcvH [bacterium]|nr:MAG: glycine cleavage system protein GcvH [bacterium]